MLIAIAVVISFWIVVLIPVIFTDIHKGNIRSALLLLTTWDLFVLIELILLGLHFKII